MTPPSGWRIPRPVWMVLLSWGMAVLTITTLLSVWIISNQRHAAAERDRLDRQQDQAMCVMIDLFTSGPSPVAGPAGDRGRAVLKAMTDYRLTLRCQD